MGGTSETLITILNNSKQINELPSLPSVEAGDLIGVYNLANDRLEKLLIIIKYTKFAKNNAGIKVVHSDVILDLRVAFLI